MYGKRLRQTLRLFTIPTSTKRTKYLKDNHIFGAIGENCNVMNRIVPLYAKLIKLGNNVRLASKVTFVTHDVTHVMLNANPNLQGKKFNEKIGCIEIQDNVFIGAGSTILYGVMIGSNVIVGAGSLVNKDIPPNSVAGGVPAKVISTFDEYIAKRSADETYPIELKPGNEIVSNATAAWCWERFYKEHPK
ncbi:MAG: acyltransferase [Hungatella sp.]|jgi:acetyltransferase-like isoleucine patch superfamily enzyme|nr:acyltransferase [Hungatella sp.]